MDSESTVDIEPVHSIDTVLVRDSLISSLALNVSLTDTVVVKEPVPDMDCASVNVASDTVTVGLLLRVLDTVVVIDSDNVTVSDQLTVLLKVPLSTVKVCSSDTDNVTVNELDLLFERVSSSDTDAVSDTESDSLTLIVTDPLTCCVNEKE